MNVQGGSSRAPALGSQMTSSAVGGGYHDTMHNQNPMGYNGRMPMQQQQPQQQQNYLSNPAMRGNYQNNNQYDGTNMSNNNYQMSNGGQFNGGNGGANLNGGSGGSVNAGYPSYQTNQQQQTIGNNNYGNGTPTNHSNFQHSTGMNGQQNNINMMAGGGSGNQQSVEMGYNSQMNNMGMHSNPSYQHYMNNGMNMNNGMHNNMNSNNGMNYNSSRQHHMNQMQNINMNGMNHMNPMNNNISGVNQMNRMNQMNNMGQMPPLVKMQGMANGYPPPRRMSPYPSAQMHAAQKRAAMYSSMTNPAMSQNQHNVPGGAMQFPHNQTNGVPVPMQPGGYTGRTSNGPINGYGRTAGHSQQLMSQQQRQMNPGYNNSMSQGQHQMPIASHSQPQQSQPQQQQFYGNAGYQNMPGFQQDMRMNYQHSPVPGNPTPPLTPATSMTPYVSPNPDVKGPSQKEEEVRLAFPVRDGVILQPFRLEHNLAVSNHVFQLKPTVYNTLLCRSDLELQLKCFHYNDEHQHTNWPASVQVSANATPLVIDRGDNKSSHRPLYLKNVCQPGRNTIQITVSTCCCSHLFVLQLVHRPTIRHVVQSVLRRGLVPLEHCIMKIKRFLNVKQMQQSQQPQGGDKENTDTLTHTVSLKCPVSFKRMTLPARGQDCKHIQCFDLESYLLHNLERNTWRCPICDVPALTEVMEIDHYMWAILNATSNSEVDEVILDTEANWKAVSKHNIKLEPDDDAKRLSKVMSPGSMQLPTWDNSQAMSPYMSPDMTSISNGSMVGGQNQSNYNNQRGGFDGYNNGVVNGHQKDIGNIGAIVKCENGNEYNTMSNNPMANLNDTINALDPLNAIEKSLNDQMPHTPHTPHTPGAGGNAGHPMTPGGPPSVQSVHNDSTNAASTNTNKPQTQNGNSSQNSSPQHQQKLMKNTNSNNMLNSYNRNDNSIHLNDVDLNSDLSFDPTTIGDGANDLNLLPDSGVDPMELLHYLDPPADLNTPPSSGSSNNQSNDDLLASFFE